MKTVSIRPSSLVSLSALVVLLSCPCHAAAFAGPPKQHAVGSISDNDWSPRGGDASTVNAVAGQVATTVLQESVKQTKKSIVESYMTMWTFKDAVFAVMAILAGK